MGEREKERGRRGAGGGVAGEREESGDVGGRVSHWQGTAEEGREEHRKLFSSFSF